MASYATQILIFQRLCFRLQKSEKSAFVFQNMIFGFKKNLELHLIVSLLDVEEEDLSTKDIYNFSSPQFKLFIYPYRVIFPSNLPFLFVIFDFLFVSLS